MSLRIILIDDHSILRDGMRFLLAREPDIEIVGEASNIHAGIGAVRLKKPALVILDLQLPDGNGVDATRMIRAEHPEIKVLLVSGSRPDSAIREALEAGASGFVYKEDASTELLRAVRSIMAGKTYLCPSATTALLGGAANAARPDSVSASAPALSERETLVLRRVAEGLRNKEIAEELELSVKSVEACRSRLMEKLHCESAADLVRYAVRQGIARL